MDGFQLSNHCLPACVVPGKCCAQLGVWLWSTAELWGAGWGGGGDTCMDCTCVDVSVKSTEITDIRPVKHGTSRQ